MDQETKQYAQEKENELGCLNIREHHFKDTRERGRDNYSRDYARVLYSSSFRRLQGKMQLLGVNETRFNRNRLTHSLEVAQIARSLAASLGLKETIIAETCALIHDIGNPPFGHAGELRLNELTSKVGGYEGNAQALRIVRSLEKKSPDFAGLNLTLRTILGCVKYCFSAEENKKKFLYDDDYKFVTLIKSKYEIKDGKTIDAQIMDLSDEIAYAAHDLEDALSSNLLVVGELIHEFTLAGEKYEHARDSLRYIVKNVQRIAGESHLLQTSEEYSIVFKKELTSQIVHELIKDIGLVESEDGKCLGYRSLSKLAEGLKKFVFRAVLRKNHIQEYESRGLKVVNGLFEVYSDYKFNKDLILLPAELRSMRDQVPHERLICDHISGMMDAFAVQEYVKYFGQSSYDSIYK